jgi:hypothetical protein
MKVDALYLPACPNLVAAILQMKSIINHTDALASAAQVLTW